MKNKKKNTVVIVLRNRLANNMFQWAFARWFEYKTGMTPIIETNNCSYLFKAFNFNAPNFDKYFQRKNCCQKFLIRKIPYYKKKYNEELKCLEKLTLKKEQIFMKYNEDFLNDSGSRIYGFFQSYKYLEPIRKILLKDFKLGQNLNQKSIELLTKIENTESVSVHFRKTDYLDSIHKNLYYNCTNEYYNSAINYIYEQTKKNIVLFVFSDDIEWAKQNFKNDFETIFVEANSLDEGYFDLELMKHCKHNIMANSSFSYMGAWLNENPNKIVVCPKKWYKPYESTYDLYPPEWKQMEGQE